MGTSRRTLAVTLTAAAFGAAVAGCGSDDGGSGPQTFPQTATVTAGTSQTFSPRSVDIAAGGMVTWNFGTLAHNVTFASGDAPDDVPATANDQVPRPFPAAGTFNYVCTIHPGMSGTVVVH
jgi:plastocyanin